MEAEADSYDTVLEYDKDWFCRTDYYDNKETVIKFIVTKYLSQNMFSLAVDIMWHFFKVAV